jgi:hypothetical protein
MMENSKENTMRVLKGQDPIQKLRCRLGWHRWTSWQVIINNNFGNTYAQCNCADCGMPRQELPYSKSKSK